MRTRSSTDRRMARSAGSARPGSAPSWLLVPLLLVAMAGAGSAADISANTMSPVWPDDRFHRLAALALLEQLRGALLTEDSATLTLENWCALHHLAPTPRVLAERDPGMDRPLDPTDRLRLDVGPVEPIRYRHVRLVCGPHLLSEADNWYVPGRLLPGMDHQLETTDTPFGKVVHPLGFTRTTLSSRLLWDPCRRTGAQAMARPHRAERWRSLTRSSRTKRCSDARMANHSRWWSRHTEAGCSLSRRPRHDRCGASACFGAHPVYRLARLLVELLGDLEHFLGRIVRREC